MTIGHSVEPPQESRRPLLFISHKHTDQRIADKLREFITEYSAGRVKVFQSSSPDAMHIPPGDPLHIGLKERLWQASVVIWIYTDPIKDWSFCVWECGIASHPSATKVLVLQYGTESPPMYGDHVRVDASDKSSLQRFVGGLLTEPHYFYDHDESILSPSVDRSEQVRRATHRLYELLHSVEPRTFAPVSDFSTLPFVRLRLQLSDVRAIKPLDALAGGRAVLDQAVVEEIDDDALRLFGLRNVEDHEPFRTLVDAWQENRPSSDTRWIDEIAEQIRKGSQDRQPTFTWQMMDSVDDQDRAKYAPVLSHVETIPRDDSRDFSIYFCRFQLTPSGAIQIGFQSETSDGQLPTIVLAATSGSQPPLDRSPGGFPPGAVDGTRTPVLSSAEFAAVMNALANTSTKQRYRTVKGIAAETQLEPAVVNALLETDNELIQRSRIPNSSGEALYRVRRK